MLELTTFNKFLIESFIPQNVTLQHITLKIITNSSLQIENVINKLPICLSRIILTKGVPRVNRTYPGPVLNLYFAQCRCICYCLF